MCIRDRDSGKEIASFFVKTLDDATTARMYDVCCQTDTTADLIRPKCPKQLSKDKVTR
jgi:hypothetical protein